eukprot:a262_287.p2 GENE.a262_287~~a262_287.p2  ORF type:complete len:217 (+),score=76.62 a262_287:34-651(+)
MADDEVTFNKWRVFKTVHAMLHSRGYVVDAASLTISYDTFVQDYGASLGADAQLNPVMVSKQTDQEKVIVFFLSGKVGSKELDNCAAKLKTADVKHGILVISGNITALAKKVAQEAGKEVSFEIFFDTELIVNITEHSLVPKHEPLTDDEKAALLARYRLQQTQLPRMNTTDPVAKFYGLKSGTVVRITRKSETAGRYITYRLVV